MSARSMHACKHGQILPCVHENVCAASRTTFPAKGMRKGSVQNTPRLAREARLLLTARDRFMGSSGGTTDARIMAQLMSSLLLLRAGSCQDTDNTYPDAASAKHSKQRMKIPYIHMHPCA